MSDVFISYKRRLRPQVEKIAVALRDLGVDVWFDAALEPGVSFSAEISNEVRNAGCVLVCFSDDAFPHGGDENGWVLGEASIGKKRGRLVTVMLDETEFDPPWNMIHTERLVGFDPADFTAERSGWRGALAAMGRLIDRPGLADYDRAIAAGTADALKGWVQMYPKDVLVERVWSRVEEIELAQVRRRLAEERVKPPEPAVPPKPAAPERVYAPLPQQKTEPRRRPSQGQAARDIRSEAESAPRSPLKPRDVLVAALAGFVCCTAGDFGLVNFGPNSILAFAVVALGGAVFMAPVAWLIDRRGAWPRRNAVLLAPFIGIEGLLVVAGWGALNSRYFETIETVFFAGLAGAAGAVLAGGTIVLLSRRGREGRVWLVLGIAALVEALALAVMIGAIPYLAHSSTGFIAMQIVWQAIFVVALPSLLVPSRPSATTSPDLN